MSTKEERKEIAKRQLEVLNEIENSLAVEHVVKNNTIEFKSRDKIFRVRKPHFAERQEIFQMRRKTYVKLLKEDSMLFRKQWVELYKTKNIDIDKMETTMKTMQAEIDALLLRLVKVEDIKAIGKIRNEIVVLRRKMWDINVEKTDLLQHSIEDQLLLVINEYTTYLVLERKEKDKWVKSFDTYEDFQKCTDDDLMTKAFEYISNLIYGGYNDNQTSEKSS